MASTETRSLRPRAVPGVTSPPDRLDPFLVYDSSKALPRERAKDAPSRKRKSANKEKDPMLQLPPKVAALPKIPKLVIEKKGGFKSRLVDQGKSKGPPKTNKNGMVPHTEPAKSKKKSKNDSEVLNHTISLSDPIPSGSAINSHIPKRYELVVKNLKEDVTKEQLEEHFRKTGGVKNIKIPKEKGTGIGKGIATIEFKDRISHGIALRLDNTTMAGQTITVEFPPVKYLEKKTTKTISLS